MPTSQRSAADASPRLTLAHQRLKSALQLIPFDEAVPQIQEAIDRFVDQLNEAPNCMVELRRRAEYLPEATKDGSPYQIFRVAALALFEPPLAPCAGKLSLGAEDAKAQLFATHPDILFPAELRRVIKLLNGPIVREQLDRGENWAPLNDWLQECYRLEDEATELNALGCYYLLHIWQDRRNADIEHMPVARAMFRKAPLKPDEIAAAADSMVECCLGNCADPSATATAWEDVAKRMEELRSQGEPWTSQAKMAKRLKCSPATINRAIKESPKLRNWAGAGAVSTPKAQSLIEVVTDRKAQSSELDPADDAAIREFIEGADPETKAWFLSLTIDAQLDYLSDADAHHRILGRKP